MNKKLIPYGISNYKSLAEKNYAYVDKTPYIEKLELYHSPFIFFLRPRRFGKSLFTSVLSNYYDVKEKDNFNKLFRNTYIGKNPTEERNSYCILSFSFSGLNTEDGESLKKEFLHKTIASFKNFISDYDLDITLEINSTEPAQVLNNFMTSIRRKLPHPIYIIIDEYDHFANELLSFKTELFQDIISKTGFVRKWYEIIKEWTKENDMVKRIFATGVSPISLDSLTSGFNIADNITRLEDFNEIMGFTESEVRSLVTAASKFELSEAELDNLMEVLKQNYNGYLFSERASERLFNSDMILYYLKYYVSRKEGPEELIDQNIASDYAKLGSIFELKNKNSNRLVLEQILKGEEITGIITNQFSLEKAFDEDDFKSLLFYLGLLTIDKKILASVSFKVPNYVIKGLYFEYFIKKIDEDIQYDANKKDISEAITDIALKGNNSKLVTLVESTLNKLSNRDYINFDEKYIKLLIFAYCILSKVYLVKSEYEVENGYIDIALLRREAVEPKYFGIFELKYITKASCEKYGTKLVEEKKQEALEQLKKYNTSQELLSLKALKKWVLVFVNDKCVVNFLYDE